MTITINILVCITLLVIAYIDFTTMEIPDALSLALLAIAVLAAIFTSEISLSSRFIGLFCVSVPLLVIAMAAPGAFGGGDIKLMAAAGFLLGWQAVIIAACIGICIGGIYGIYLLIRKKKSTKEHFAFGPALCLGIALALFFAPDIVSWYRLM